MQDVCPVAPAVDPPVGQLLQLLMLATPGVQSGENVLDGQPVHVLPSPYSPSAQATAAEYDKNVLQFLCIFAHSSTRCPGVPTTLKVCWKTQTLPDHSLKNARWE